MKKQHVVTALLLISLQTAFSQTKDIKGDTAFGYKRNIGLQRGLNLKDFQKSTDDFNFRFKNHGQAIEVSKDTAGIYGSITNFIYHTKKERRNTTEILSNKIVLSSKQAAAIYQIILNSKILTIPSDSDIENWSHGTDGITYIIEHSDKNNHWIKKYWTPSTQEAVPEAIVVLDFVKKISDTLNLQEIYTSFKNTLPKKGCYHSGGISYVCYISNSLAFGYSGATKLPFGFYASYSATYIGKTKINGSVSLQYNFDRNGFHHLNLQTAKWNIFHKKSNLSDFIAYSYQNRLLNADKTHNRFENHQIKYGYNFKKNLGIGIGLDYIGRNHHKMGGHLYAQKWFSKPDISAVLHTSIFDNRIHYKAEVFKLIRLNHQFPINSISTGVTYEDFMNYKDLYFSVYILL